jgi:hypothetical protein
MSDALTRMRVLRASGYRCGIDVGGGKRCNAWAALLAHPHPERPAPMVAVCKEHAKAARP